MNPIESALLSALNKHPEMPLVIAYSGGVDSQVLLHALASLKEQNQLSSNPITVCHVNHGLSDNASAWQSFAEQSCLALQLPLKVCQVNVQAQAQQSLEALARDARYQALQSIYQQRSLIITGHHSDDQAETFLLALKRGSGLKGLSAMAIETKQTKDLLVRPLLSITRGEIVNYAQQHNLAWVEDESNTDTRFDRNFIRNDIMPLLTQRWPSIVHTINRSSEHCSEGQLLLNELAEDDLALCQIDTNILCTKSLKQLSQRRFNNVIRYFLSKNNCLMPSTEQLIQVHRQLNAENDKNPTVKVGEHFFRRYRASLYLTPNFEDVSGWQEKIILSSHGNQIKKVELPDNLGQLYFDTSTSYQENKKQQAIIMPSKGQAITIRFEHNNPNCLPDYRQHSRSLKKVLQELNIPPWQRKRIPFLYYDDTLVAAIGYFVCQAYVVKASLSDIALPIECEPNTNLTSYVIISTG